MFLCHYQQQIVERFPLRCHVTMVTKMKMTSLVGCDTNLAVKFRIKDCTPICSHGNRSLTPLFTLKTFL